MNSSLVRQNSINSDPNKPEDPLDPQHCFCFRWAAALRAKRKQDQRMRFSSSWWRVWLILSQRVSLAKTEPVQFIFWGVGFRPAGINLGNFWPRYTSSWISMANLKPDKGYPAVYRHGYRIPVWAAVMRLCTRVTVQLPVINVGKKRIQSRFQICFLS
jgi:hypothetical protein